MSYPRKDFMRIRHYRFLANRCRRAKLARIGECLNRPTATDEDALAEATHEA